MRNQILSNLDRVVSLGGGHGLGRVMSALSFLGSGLTGIVTTTDDGGSSGRIRKSEGGIAWGDTRNCLNQLIEKPSTVSAIFEYRFKGRGELAGHSLGNLILKALENLSIRPLEAINLVRRLLRIDASLIPMSEQAVDLQATLLSENTVYGEVAIDQLKELPVHLQLTTLVSATNEAISAINNADLITIGPGSFLTSLMPLLLVHDLAYALRYAQVPIIYLDNLNNEYSVAAANMKLIQKIHMMEQAIGRDKVINGVITRPNIETNGLSERIVISLPLAASNDPRYHDRALLCQALNLVLQLMR